MAKRPFTSDYRRIYVRERRAHTSKSYGPADTGPFLPEGRRAPHLPPPPPPPTVPETGDDGLEEVAGLPLEITCAGRTDGRICQTVGGRTDDDLSTEFRHASHSAAGPRKTATQDERIADTLFADGTRATVKIILLLLLLLITLRGRYATGVPLGRAFSFSITNVSRAHDELRC